LGVLEVVGVVLKRDKPKVYCLNPICFDKSTAVAFARQTLQGIDVEHLSNRKQKNPNLIRQPAVVGRLAQKRPIGDYKVLTKRKRGSKSELIKRISKSNTNAF
jgi:hypothetical protein